MKTENTTCNCNCHKKPSEIDRIRHCLEEVLAIDPDELKRIVQQAHEYDFRRMDEPPEVFAISRQALRMFWRFRRNLEGVKTHAAANTAKEKMNV